MADDRPRLNRDQFDGDEIVTPQALNDADLLLAAEGSAIERGDGIVVRSRGCADIDRLASPRHQRLSLKKSRSKAAASLSLSPP